MTHNNQSGSVGKGNHDEDAEEDDVDEDEDDVDENEDGDDDGLMVS